MAQYNRTKCMYVHAKGSRYISAVFCLYTLLASRNLFFFFNVKTTDVCQFINGFPVPLFSSFSSSISFLSSLGGGAGVAPGYIYWQRPDVSSQRGLNSEITLLGNWKKIRVERETVTRFNKSLKMSRFVLRWYELPHAKRRIKGALFTNIITMRMKP